MKIPVVSFDSLRSLRTPFDSRVWSKTMSEPREGRVEWCPQRDSNPRYRLEGPMS